MRGSARHTVAWLRVFVRACSRCSHPALAISLCCAAWKTLGPPRTTEWLPLRLRGKPTEKWAQTRWQTVVEWKKIKKKPPHDFWAFFFWLTGHFCFDVSHARCTRRIRLCESCTKFRSARICQTVSQTRKPARGEKITYLQMLPGRAIFSIFLLVSFLSWNSFSIIEIKKVTSRMP